MLPASAYCLRQRDTAAFDDADASARYALPMLMRAMRAVAAYHLIADAVAARCRARHYD